MKNKIQVVSHRKNGVLSGAFIVKYSNGTIKYMANLKHGKLDGVVGMWSQYGVLMKIALYDSGVLQQKFSVM